MVTRSTALQCVAPEFRLCQAAGPQMLGGMKMTSVLDVLVSHILAWLRCNESISTRLRGQHFEVDSATLLRA